MNTCLFKISFPEERGDPELPAAAGRAETPARLTAQSFRGREQRRQNAFGKAFLLGWRNGRRSGLKIRWPLAVRVRVPSRVRCRRPRMREGGSDAAKRPPLSTRATPHKRIWRGRRPINSAPAPQFADFPRQPQTQSAAPYAPAGKITPRKAAPRRISASRKPKFLFAGESRAPGSPGRPPVCFRKTPRGFCLTNSPFPRRGGPFRPQGLKQMRAVSAGAPSECPPSRTPGFPPGSPEIPDFCKA